MHVHVQVYIYCILERHFCHMVHSYYMYMYM